MQFKRCYVYKALGPLKAKSFPYSSQSCRDLNLCGFPRSLARPKQRPRSFHSQEKVQVEREGLLQKTCPILEI